MGVNGRHGYRPEGGYEVHFHGQGSKERVANIGGVVMDGNREYQVRDGNMEGWRGVWPMVIVEHSAILTGMMQATSRARGPEAENFHY